MATSNEDFDGFSLGDDEEPDRFNGTELDEEEEQPQGGKQSPGEEPGRLGWLAGSLKGRWWMTIGVLVFLFAGLGLGVTQGTKWIPKVGHKIRPLSSARNEKHDFYEEKLPPFFIPLQPDAANQAVMIDFSVIWDGLASFRYKSMALQIRNRLYWYLVGLSEKEQGLEEKVAFIEAQLSKIFRESLGMEDLAIKIKEIREI